MGANQKENCLTSSVFAHRHPRRYWSRHILAQLKSQLRSQCLPSLSIRLGLIGHPPATDGHRYILAVAWLHTACASEVIGAAIVLPISTFRSVWKQSHSFVNIWNKISIFSFYLGQIFLDMTDTHGLEFGAEQLSLLAVLKTRIPRVQMRLCMQNAFTKTGLTCWGANTLSTDFSICENKT